MKVTISQYLTITSARILLKKSAKIFSFGRYKEMAETFKDVEYIPGGATLNTLRVAQVCICLSVSLPVCICSLLEKNVFFHFIFIVYLMCQSMLYLSPILELLHR